MKKSEKSNGKIILDLDKLIKGNTKLKLVTLGEVELKSISIGDAEHFSEILAKEELTDKDFVLKVLYRQLIKPQIGFEKFKQLSDEDLLKIGTAFVRNEDDTFQHFQDSGDFYKDFRIAIKSYQEKQLDYMKEYCKQIMAIAKEELNSIQKSFASMARNILAGYLEPIFDSFRKFAEQNLQIFDNIGKFWGNFREKYDIAEGKAVRVLQKYKWFITPGFPASFVFKIMQLDKRKGRNDKLVNNLFIQHFSANNWQNLEIMVKGWRSKPLLKRRVKILMDCVQTLKQIDGGKVNVGNVILPTLITQIDGALTDYLDSKNIKWECLYDDLVREGRVQKVGRKTQFRKSKQKILTTALDDLANDVFLNILFQKAQKGKPLKTPFNFNRHKIVHGESTAFGRKDYLVRAFMVLDFLGHLK